ncbi:MAG TPA: GNAT family N-acetyltransferase [Microscillaceae bacterium]|nr:GNAT family N-acetyltransferase [Microscillaceae bacterium]
MNYSIEKTQKSDYQDIIEIWEASVRTTHHFLTEEDILYFKPLILDQYLDAVELRVARNEQGVIVGFLGVAEQGLEMLFLHPEYIGKGLGRQLMEYAFEHLQVNKVDVNEDNPKAAAFYKKMGFKVVSRSELDNSGKPYPILHMEL